MKRNFDLAFVRRDNSRNDAKVILTGVSGQAKPVGEAGNADQRRRSSTAAVSADAIRFTPKQVLKSRSTGTS